MSMISTIPEKMTPVCAYAIDCTSVVNLANHATLKRCDYFLVQNNSGTNRVRIDGTNPDSSTGVVLASNAWHPDIVSGNDVRILGGTVNVIGYLRPPRTA